MAKQKKAKKVDEFIYKDHTVKTEYFDVDQVVKIDKEEISFDRDSDTNAYISIDAPYQSFGTLGELAKAIIDAR